MIGDPLPGLADVEVRWVTELSQEISHGVEVGEYTVAAPGVLLRSIPGVARFLAREGRVIEVEPAPGADQRLLVSLLQGPIAAALIHQRGELPLHAATVAHPTIDRAFSIVGRQGAGKSTLAYELCRRGWRLLSDDLTRITTNSGGVLAWPGRRGIKLCADACDGFAMDRTTVPSLPGLRGKYLVDSVPLARPLMLDRVFVLDRGNPVATSSVSRAAAMAMLSSNTMRMRYVCALGVAALHLQIVARIAGAIDIVTLGGMGSPSVFANEIESAVDDKLYCQTLMPRAI